MSPQFLAFTRVRTWGGGLGGVCAFSISRNFAVSACKASVASWQALTKALLAWKTRASDSLMRLGVLLWLGRTVVGL
jgi:hypothetical protein